MRNLLDAKQEMEQTAEEKARTLWAKRTVELLVEAGLDAVLAHLVDERAAVLALAFLLGGHVGAA